MQANERKSRRMLRRFCWLAAVLLMLAPAGCGYDVGVRRAGAMPLWSALQASFFEGNDLSPRTQQTLRNLDLADQYRRQPETVCASLHQLATGDPQPDYLFALAEMNYHLGCRAEKQKRAEAVAHYYLCSGYAYHYLFQGGGDTKPRAVERGQQADVTEVLPPLIATMPTPSALPSVSSTSLPPGGWSLTAAFDPRFRLACDLYNAGLRKCIRAAQRSGRLDARQQLFVPTPDGGYFTLEVAHHGFAWRPEEFGELTPCSDYEVYGLQNHYRTYGLGVPLIGVRAAGATDCAPGHAFYPREVSFPVTAFFRFGGSLADLKACRAGRLELYNPLATQAIQVAGRSIPLETDLTTPLAYFLDKTDLEETGVIGFLRADRIRDRSGVYLFEPYEPGKIPVVMVHGLLSSPLTWAPLFNELRADPELRKHYQFWFYLYPTGNPYPVTAADLRDTLARLRNDLDPQRRDGAMDRMVFVGHSMGGLVSKLVTQDSGGDFWSLISTRPFDEIKGSNEARAELQRIFFFERQESVRRVIFLGTPHRGSSLTPSPVGKLAERFVKLPRRLMTVANEVIAENPGVWPSLGDDPNAPNLPTSLDLLKPGSPALELLAHRPAPPGVQYHSIIGVILGNGENGTDGAVTYRSAHLDSTASEVVIPAHHNNVHHHPRTVLEVKRILSEHLDEVRSTAFFIRN